MTFLSKRTLHRAQLDLGLETRVSVLREAQLALVDERFAYRRIAHFARLRNFATRRERYRARLEISGASGASGWLSSEAARFQIRQIRGRARLDVAPAPNYC
jgi:hypothetical protein